MMYEIWCEWDMGFSDLLFNSKPEALEYAQKVIDEAFKNGELDCSFEEAQGYGLVGVTEKHVHQ